MASEFLVTTGGEINGADIKYRGERGHAVGGVVKSSGPSKGGYAFSVVTLMRARHAGAAGAGGATVASSVADV